MRRRAGPTTEDLSVAVLTTLVIYLLAVGSVLLAPAGTLAAPWWPAAGVGVAAAVLLGRHRRWVLLAVVVGTTMGNLSGGRSIDLALAYGLANGLEVLVSAWVLTRAGSVRLSDMVDLRRLAVAAVAGTVVMGVGVAGAASLLAGGSFVETWLTVTPSHAAAQMLVVPAVLAARAGSGPRRRLERTVQVLLLAALTTLVFHVSHLPLAFLPLTALVWGAVRLGLRTVTLELCLLGVAVTLLSARGGGPFAVVEGGTVSTPVLATVVIQVFTIAYVIVVLPLALAVRQREQAMQLLGESEALFRDGFTESLLGMLLLRRDADGLRVVRANPVAAHLLGATGDLTGALFPDRFAATERPLLVEAVDDLVAGRTTGWRRELPSATVPARWLDVALSLLPRDDGSVLLSVQMVDVTARREAEEQLARLALHDGLTGLANRVLLRDRLDQALAVAQRSGSDVALLFCDLDDFKQVNDSAGHHVGDAVLRAVADRLAATARASDTVARIGGDEFVVLCPQAVDGGQAQALADRVVRVLGEPVEVAGRRYEVRVSVGVVVADVCSDADSLLRAADTAMYAAKAQGKGRAVVFADA